MLFPANPIAAVTHADPYPYYAELVAGSTALLRSGAGAVGGISRRDRCHNPKQPRCALVRPLGRAGAKGAAWLAGRRRSLGSWCA